MENLMLTTPPDAHPLLKTAQPRMESLRRTTRRDALPPPLRDSLKTAQLRMENPRRLTRRDAPPLPNPSLKLAQTETKVSPMLTSPRDAQRSSPKTAQTEMRVRPTPLSPLDAQRPSPKTAQPRTENLLRTTRKDAPPPPKLSESFDKFIYIT